MADKHCQHCGGLLADNVCEDCGHPANKGSLLTPGTGDGGATASSSMGLAENATGLTGKTGRTSTRFTVNYPSRKVAAGGATTSRRSHRTTHTSTRRNSLGGGLISLPDMPSQDPLKLLMTDPQIPEHKRRCPACDAKVSRTKGFCPTCGAQYNFEPQLGVGDLVNGKYEVKGPIAFGGLGWIYLGWDNVLSRWVVLKGLLNTNDHASAAAAVAERQFLAAVKHAKIVGIYDFVHHGAAGYIVMEFVGGVTVHSLRKQRGPLPVEEAVAYILGILPAFGYLHAQKMVYCDFKPDNLMLEGGDIKLIDMGATRKIGDPNGDIYGTVGYMAPEANDDPREVSDLYSVGRALATLIMDFKFASDFEHTLPNPDQQTILAENESLYRFLLRATHEDPDERFQTAEEMADQLFGVLREIVALRSEPRPVDSKVFTGDTLLSYDPGNLLQKPRADVLPAIRVDLTDRATSEVMRVLTTGTLETRTAELRKLVERYKDRAVEPKLRLAEALFHHVEAKASTEAQSLLAEIEQSDAYDWRVYWLRGIGLLLQQQGKAAIECFERVYFEMPGEIAPRLAMGFASEIAGDYEQGVRYYDRVGRVDPGFVSANFGLARCYAKLGQIDEAIEALRRIPTSHGLRNAAMLAIVELVLENEDKINTERLRAAEESIRAALPEGGIAFPMAGRLIACVASRLKSRQLAPSSDGQFLSKPMREKSLRREAETYFRKAARHAEGIIERTRWITLANKVRPLTLF